MDKYEAKEIVLNSIDRFVKLNHNGDTAYLQPNEISAEIIINGALAVIKKRNRNFLVKNQEDNHYGIDERETLMSNLTSWMRFRDNIRNIPEYVEIINSFKDCSKLILGYLSEEDINYTENQIYEVLSHSEPEVVISNYFKNLHEFDPLGLEVNDNTD